MRYLLLPFNRDSSLRRFAFNLLSNSISDSMLGDIDDLLKDVCSLGCLEKFKLESKEEPSPSTTRIVLVMCSGVSRETVTVVADGPSTPSRCTI